MEQAGSWALGGNFRNDFNKEMLGKWSTEDPELSKAIPLLISIKNCTENGAGRIWALGSNFHIDFDKGLKDNGARGILSSREQFPIDFN